MTQALTVLIALSALALMGSMAILVALLIMKAIKSFMKKEGFDVMESKEKYASNISGYATSDANEYIAESFCAWWYGEKDILDPELVKIFEGALK